MSNAEDQETATELSSRRINWKEVVVAVKKELSNFRYKPTLRTMFYRLFSNGLIPNTANAYDRLSKVTVDARWNGLIPIDCFADNSRKVEGDFNEEYWTPEELIDARIEMLRATENDYTEYIPRWHNQPQYVEVWIEKDAMVGTFLSILEGLEVRIIPNKGFASLTFLQENAQRLEHFLKIGKSVHVLYYGDFDPSGAYMDTDLRNRLDRLGLGNRIDFQRVSVTPEQIEQFDLPYNPDEETAEKMRRDVQTNSFLEKYGKLYAVELDALPAKIPDEFRRLVVNSVEQYFDEDIYEELLKKYTSEEIKKLLKTKIKGLQK